MTQDRPTDRARACRRRRPHTRATMFTVSAPSHASLRAFKPNTVRANEFVDRARAMARRRATTRRRDDASRCVIGARRRVSERIRTRPDARDAAWTSSAGAGTRVKKSCARCRRRWRRAQSARRRGARGAIRGSGGVGFSGSARFRARFRARACDD